MNPVDQLSAVASRGRRMPEVLKDPESEQVFVTDPTSTPCPKCGRVTGEGEPITKMFGTWWHLSCAEEYLKTTGVDEAWRVLGTQLAAHPRGFNVTQTRAIVQNLLRMAGGTEDVRTGLRDGRS
ncbi:hypothetical protein ACFXG4_04740 [Nocardia sp. NPDC059246]|uniref:hypothetical protein n=1 Tax=unclassified Nocardia TaxID=2637762 RepID=UPI003696E67E